MKILLILLLALPAFGHDDPNRSLVERYERALADTLMEWVTVRVDSLNLGVDGCTERRVATPPGAVALGMFYESFHEWVVGPVRKPPGDLGPEDLCKDLMCPIAYEHGVWRERICRHCVRREWRALQKVPPPPSEFDQLKARLK